MKDVFIIRHAKSDWSIDGLVDIDRALNARGYNDAHNVGTCLRKKGHIPQMIISSPAVRALTTALIFSDELSFSKSNIRIEPDLYETGWKDYMAIINSLPEAISSVFIFGHNPIVSDLSSHLSGRVLEMPTCAVARFSLSEGKWNSLSVENIEFIEMLTPKTIL
ncbi:MAG: SixA phosphatase family protein [Bacteroidota bacterium]